MLVPSLPPGGRGQFREAEDTLFGCHSWGCTDGPSASGQQSVAQRVPAGTWFQAERGLGSPRAALSRREQEVAGCVASLQGVGHGHLIRPGAALPISDELASSPGSAAGCCVTHSGHHPLWASVSLHVSCSHPGDGGSGLGDWVPVGSQPRSLHLSCEDQTPTGERRVRGRARLRAPHSVSPALGQRWPGAAGSRGDLAGRLLGAPGFWAPPMSVLPSVSQSTCPLLSLSLPW